MLINKVLIKKKECSLRNFAALDGNLSASSKKCAMSLLRDVLSDNEAACTSFAVSLDDRSS